MTAAITVPQFDLELSGGGRLRSDDLRGRRTLFYFYPKDDTPGCTLEGREFSALASQFLAAGVSVYGVSPDSARSHDKFAAKCDLGIPLISDPERQLCGAFDVWVEKSLYGRQYMGVERSTFLLGPGLTVEKEWRRVKPAGHARAVLDEIGG